MVMRGFANMTTWVAWLELGAFCAAALLLAPEYALPGLAAARLFSILVTSVMVALAARKHCGIHLRGIAMVLVRPVVGSCLMAGVIMAVLQWVQLPALQLLVGVLCGGGFFAAWSFLTWHLVGRPDGFESTLIEMLPSRKPS
jgi:peptidoglycan biosynthesis protein MviN/MurJ (putative lipid II flippase)